MKKNQETITDIIAEKRRRADEIERACDERMEGGKAMSVFFTRRLVADIRKEADRLEAARKREIVEVSTRAATQAVNLTEEKHTNTPIGNCAKLREALEFIKQYFDKIDPFNISTYTFSQIEVDHINEAIDAALAAKPRNCDVGTAEEQSKLWWKFCDKHFIYSPAAKDNCAKCPVRGTNRHCELAWAQMPYEEGGAK